MIVTLCGSGRFEPWFHMWNEALGLSGHSVFGMTSYASFHQGKTDWFTPEEKKVLDQVHFNKIEASDAVLFLNVFAYLGESTLKEFTFSKVKKKNIYFLESWGQGRGIGGNHVSTHQSAARFYDVFAKGSPIDVFHGAHDWGRSRDPYDLLPEAGAYRSGIVDRLNARKEAAIDSAARQWGSRRDG